MSAETEVGTEEWERRIAAAREEAEGGSGWWYLSFAVPNVEEGGTAPVGEGFLGGLYIDAASLPDAITKSHELGLNPGGQVSGWQLPPEAMKTFEQNVPSEMRLRLLSKA